eukprot:PITA_29504
MYLTEEILKKNLDVCVFVEVPSLDTWQTMLAMEVPRLPKEAAEKAIHEWGQSKSSITQFIFFSKTTPDLSRADFEVAKLWGLHPSVKRVGVFQHCYFARGTVLQLATDLAENNRGARVLVICSETTPLPFADPSRLTWTALWGKLCSVMVPLPSLRETMPSLKWRTHVSKSFGQPRQWFPTATEPSMGSEFRIPNWNQLFWVVHPGGCAILDRVEAKLNLDPTKLIPTRHIMSEYGNMSNVCIHFILDKTRKASQDNGCSTNGE